MKQNKQDRRNESRAMKDYYSGYDAGHNSKYGYLPQKDFGHASRVYDVAPISYEGCGKVEVRKYMSKGYDQEAWDYSW